MSANKKVLILNQSSSDQNKFFIPKYVQMKTKMTNLQKTVWNISKNLKFYKPY